MPASRPTEKPAPARSVFSGGSMRDLLASCAAADAVSRPPAAPEPGTPAPAARLTEEPAQEHRDAA
ncbi:hypothetical protein OIB37_22115 [Streptomyces sp. NBC_00820]|uniref:hypothetical protein n=1 Tax=Streptomyces sp. NBC_00820 TaxID=2975842 RepID=UPI002ED253AD|nr:hypothetical protein OIB37_22115 [Streptomyces sp. NBC_00820]